MLRRKHAFLSPSQRRRTRVQFKALAMCALTLTYAEAAYASRWTPFAEIAGDLYFIDADAIVIQDSVSTFWLKTVFAELGEKGLAASIEKWMHDCQNNRAKMIAVTLYKSNGQIIGSGEQPRYEIAWKAISPGSRTEKIHHQICQSSSIPGTAPSNKSPLEETY